MRIGKFTIKRSIHSFRWIPEHVEKTILGNGIRSLRYGRHHFMYFLFFVVQWEDRLC